MNFNIESIVDLEDCIGSPELSPLGGHSDNGDYTNPDNFGLDNICYLVKVNVENDEGLKTWFTFEVQPAERLDRMRSYSGHEMDIWDESEESPCDRWLRDFVDDEQYQMIHGEIESETEKLSRDLLKEMREDEEIMDGVRARIREEEEARESLREEEEARGSLRHLYYD